MIKEHERPKEFDLEGVVPWGRRFEEYREFFALDDVPAGVRIVDVGGGPASFAAEAAALGYDVTAVDPIYALDAAAIARRFEETREAMMAGVRLASYRFRWKRYGSPEALERIRREALALFLADFERAGRTRYVPGELPHLPFAADAFDLALSSHFLFLYGDELDSAFHIAAVRELARVAREVRIFPLVNLDGRPSSHLPAVMEAMDKAGLFAELVPVDFEFQIGATKMLKVGRR